MDPRNTINLATNADAEGNFPSDDGITVDGGEYQLFIDGDFNGATAALKYATASGGTFTADSNGSFTEATAEKYLRLGKGAAVLLAVSGAGSPAPDITAKLVPVRAWS